MSVAIRRRNDHVEPLTALPSLVVERSTDAALLAVLQQRSLGEIERRFADGHRAYIARLAGEPAAFGWVATRRASIGELGTTFAIPAAHRYLWNFVTLASHRGLGIYPRLLDAIVGAEHDAEVFWIAYAPENRASGSGIAKAGFRTVAALSFDRDGTPVIGQRAGDAQSEEAARVFHLPLARWNDVAQCWKCVRAGRGAMSCAPGACRCDYQRPATACA